MNDDKAARYHALKHRAVAASLAWSGGLLAVLAATPASVHLRELAGTAAGRALPPWLQPEGLVLVYVILLGVLREAGALPISFFREYLLEHRYGLSTETLRRWALDRLKGGAIEGSLALAGLSLLYPVVRRWPEAWWIAAALGVTAVVVLLTGLAPVLVMPLFFTCRPLPRQALRDRLLALSRRAGVTAVDAREWQVSDRTKKANAALAGLGRTRRILVSDTLLASHSDDEVEAVLAHELGHHAHHDVWRGVALQALVACAGFFVASRLLPVLAPRLGWAGTGDVAGLPVLLLAVGAVSLAFMPVVNALSRRAERAADRFAFELTGRAADFAAAMRRLGDLNLEEVQPTRASLWFFHTHPPTSERIAAARAWDEAHAAGGARRTPGA